MRLTRNTKGLKITNGILLCPELIRSRRNSVLERPNCLSVNVNVKGKLTKKNRNAVHALRRKMKSAGKKKENSLKRQGDFNVLLKKKNVA